MKKEEKKRNLFGKEYLMASAVALSLLAGASKTQTVKADTVNNNTDTAAKTAAVAATANTNATTDNGCLLYTSPSPRDRQKSRMPSSA